MKTCIVTIKPRTAFATRLKGDTLFGQLCWAVRHTLGEEQLITLLDDYHQNPFVVISDAMLNGYLPKPIVPAVMLGLQDQNASERKAIKKRNWLPKSILQQPLTQWQQQACSDKDILGTAMKQQSVQAHNTISRLTGTTGKGDFAPFQITPYWYAPQSELEVYVTLDEQQLSTEQLQHLLIYIGASGYGKEASAGLGKFDVLSIAYESIETHAKANAWLTLAPSVIQSPEQSIKWDSSHCFYQPFTRFGRHGDQLALSGQPFKNPILMIDSAAVLTPENWQQRTYIGSALGGKAKTDDTKYFGELSKALPETVHQGYTPVLPVYMPLAN